MGGQTLSQTLWLIDKLTLGANSLKMVLVYLHLVCGTLIQTVSATTRARILVTKRIVWSSWRICKPLNGDCESSINTCFLRIQWTNMCHLATIDVWQSLKATISRLHLFDIVWLYVLKHHSQRPSYKKLFTDSHCFSHGSCTVSLLKNHIDYFQLWTHQASHTTPSR